ncbi:hypothetical protein EXIGLDRAFT_760871 [Exidia glandulosa HHB12029]|uniref:F-box domain-containing protein n=1 Tax=Exidia glandulosa HHB12029 TaxID=1314781 RepID=A0A165NY34_EXIGL|nr:hypothetical protein EXIGLDRAFT_760871 [Exidia glandulosa HHB12029]
MAQLPSELLSEVFSLACAERTHDIEQKLRLAQVCADWRAVALGYPSFWATIRVETSRDAAWLPMALARGGDSALDVELWWQHTGYSPSFSDAEEQAVVDALMAPKQLLRLKRLFVAPAAPVLLSALLGPGSKFPALEDLEFQEDFEYFAPVADRLEAPSLRRLVLSGLCPASYDFLDTPSLEHLSIKNAFPDEKDRLLTTILYRCTALRFLDWGVRDESFRPTISDETQRPLASRLKILRLGVCVPFSDILRFIDRLAVDPLPEIAVTIEGGEANMALLVDLFSRMGALLDLHFDDTHEEIAIRDDVGRIRRLVSFNNDPLRGMNDLWCTLARLYTIDQSLRSLRVRTQDWHELAGGFASRAPTALTELYIVLRGRMQGLHRDLDREGDDFFETIDTMPPTPTRVLKLPSLRRLIIVKDWLSTIYAGGWPDYDPCRDLTIPHMRAILQHIECDASSRVEVCVSVPELFEGRTLPLATQETLMDGLDDKWVLCSHCTGT